MPTPISDFREMIRLVLGDNDPDIPDYSNDQLDAAVKLAARTGKIPGYSVSGADLTPDLIPEDDPDSYALVIFHAAKRFAVTITSESVRTRAASLSSGDKRELVMDILIELYDREAGEGIY